jgi:predicted outer membrane repeat protein
MCDWLLIGGAIYVSADSSGDPYVVTVTVNTTDFTGNQADSLGGAIFFSSSNPDSSLSLRDVNFQSNSAGGSPNDVYVYATDFTCVVEAGSSAVIDGSTSGTCIEATPAPTGERLTFEQPVLVAQ